MLTLKELKKIVKVADVEKRIPSVKSLKEHKVVVKEMINADTTISVYDHGYVLYTAGNQSTVFPLHSCDDYEYVSVTGDNKEFNKEFFDNENWYIRLLMEAEDRMAYSQSKISTNHGVFSNSDVTDDAEIMRGSSKDFVDDVIDREILNALIKELTERQEIFQQCRQQQFHYRFREKIWTALCSHWNPVWKNFLQVTAIRNFLKPWQSFTIIPLIIQC